MPLRLAEATMHPQQLLVLERSFCDRRDGSPRTACTTTATAATVPAATAPAATATSAAATSAAALAPASAAATGAAATAATATDSDGSSSAGREVQLLARAAGEGEWRARSAGGEGRGEDRVGIDRAGLARRRGQTAGGAGWRSEFDVRGQP